MTVRRLAEKQPESFAFSEANLAWARKEIAKYPAGRQASAVISLLWRAQEQEGWVTEPAIRTVAEMLGMPKMRVLEIATFYTMFQLEPVGRIAHLQVCGTTPCWLRGANDLKDVCRTRIHHDQHHLSSDGAFSWEEVECLGACVNAPLVQIGADTYEDLTGESLSKLIDDLAAGRPVKPGTQIDRQNSAPVGGPTTLTTIGGEPAAPVAAAVVAAPAASAPSDEIEVLVSDAAKPQLLTAARAGGPDDLQRIKGIGPKLEEMLHGMGVFHFDQIAAWTEDNLRWVDQNLGAFRGRAVRDQWIAQARAMMAKPEAKG